MHACSSTFQCSSLAARAPTPPDIPRANPWRHHRVLQVREVTHQYTLRDMRWKAEAILALQEAAEAYLVGLFEDT